MALTLEGLAKFAEIYSQEFSQTLTQDEVEHKARMLLNLYLAVYRSPLEVAKAHLFEFDNTSSSTYEQSKSAE